MKRTRKFTPLALGLSLLVGFALTLPAKVATAGFLDLVEDELGFFENVASEFEFVGFETSAGATTTNTDAYTTTDIHFAGIAEGGSGGVWEVTIDVLGDLGPNGEPVLCDPMSPVTITGGTWTLETLGGKVKGQVEGTLEFRPDGPVDGNCLGPVEATVTLTVTSATGQFQGVTVATVANASLDHSFFPPILRDKLQLNSP
ncbi:MAG: hypothetical protein ACREYC_23260 [Gammaproteobacteria bacterium]